MQRDENTARADDSPEEIKLKIVAVKQDIRALQLEKLADMKLELAQLEAEHAELMREREAELEDRVACFTGTRWWCLPVWKFLMPLSFEYYRSAAETLVRVRAEHEEYTNETS